MVLSGQIIKSYQTIKNLYLNKKNYIFVKEYNPVAT